MSELVPRPSGAIAASPSTSPIDPEVWRTFGEIAKVVADTEFVPAGLRGNEPAVIACLLYGHEQGLGPMQSLENVSIIDGRPSMSAALMVAKVRMAGHRMWREELRTEDGAFIGVRAYGRRADGTEDSYAFTASMAQRAGLAGKANYQRYPEAMCWARAASQLCRMLFPDVFFGSVYTPEELGADVDESGYVEGLPTQEEAAAAVATLEAAAATTVEQASAVAPEAPGAPAPEAPAETTDEQGDTADAPPAASSEPETPPAEAWRIVTRFRQGEEGRMIFKTADEKQAWAEYERLREANARVAFVELWKGDELVVSQDKVETPAAPPAAEQPDESWAALVAELGGADYCATVEGQWVALNAKVAIDAAGNLTDPAMARFLRVVEERNRNRSTVLKALDEKIEGLTPRDGAGDDAGAAPEADGPAQPEAAASVVHGVDEQGGSGPDPAAAASSPPEPTTAMDALRKAAAAAGHGSAAMHPPQEPIAEVPPATRGDEKLNAELADAVDRDVEKATTITAFQPVEPAAPGEPMPTGHELLVLQLRAASTLITTTPGVTKNPRAWTPDAIVLGAQQTWGPVGAVADVSQLEDYMIEAILTAVPPEIVGAVKGLGAAELRRLAGEAGRS